jgi:hypothetical protein
MVATPEDVQQFLVGDDGRIEVDLEGLGVVAEAAIGGIALGAAGVAYPGADDAMDGPELGLRTPESAQGKGGGLRLGRHCGIQGRNLQPRR